MKHKEGVHFTGLAETHYCVINAGVRGICLFRGFVFCGVAALAAIARLN